MRFAILHTGAHGHPDTTVYDREFANEGEARVLFAIDFPGRSIVRVKEIS